MILNRDNTDWKDGTSNIILGQPGGLLNSINRKHTKLFSLYKKQKQMDWSEHEIALTQSADDFKRCPKEIADLMILNIASQWELDNVAARSVAVLLAPFLTDSDAWLAISKNAEMENTHWLTYSEIVRLCIADPQQVFKQIMENEKVLSRAETIEKVLVELREVGCLYTLGKIENNQELYNKVFLGFVAIFLLERCVFMSTFHNTFAVVKTGWFQGIGALVQKIMLDEFEIHCNTMQYILEHEMGTRRGAIAFASQRDIVETMLREMHHKEYEWNAYAFSKGAKLIGYNENLANLGVDWHMQHVCMVFGITPWFDMQVENPLPFMAEFMDIDKIQNAQQEGDGNNYELNALVDDIPSDKEFSFTFRAPKT